MPGPADSPRPGLADLFDAGALDQWGDDDLLDRFEAAQGSAEAGRAFEAIIQRHGGMVLRVARARVDTEADARDVFQATFALLALRSRSIRHREALGAWLFGVASRVATRARLDAIRRRSRERRAAVPEADPALDPARLDHDPDLAPILRGEVDRLPSRHRAAVVLCDLEGLPVAEAARRLGCPPGTLKSWASRGRARLRSRLAARGLAPPGWEPRPLVLPLALVRSTGHLARLVHLADAARPPIAASILTLIQGASRPMWLSTLSPWLATATLAAATAGAVAWTRIGDSSAPRPSSPSVARSPSPHASADSLSPPRREAFRRAIEAIEADPDLANRTESLIRIGRSLGRQGDREGARVLLDRAQKAMDAAPADTRWRIPHPILDLAQAWSEIGDRTAMHRAFERFQAIVVAMPGIHAQNQYINAFPLESRLDERAVADLATAYRGFLSRNPRQFAGVWRWIEETKATAYAGRWDEAITSAENPPAIRGEYPTDLKARALVAISEALRPSDPAAVIDARLDRALAAVNSQATGWSRANHLLTLIAGQPPGRSRTDHLLSLMKTSIRLGRLDRAEELGEQIGQLDEVRQGDTMGSVHRFNLAMSYDSLAEGWNRIEQPEKARVNARRALEIVPQLEELGEKIMPFQRAIEALIRAGADDEALRVVEATPPELLPARQFLPAMRATRGHDPALIERWRTLGAARVLQELNEVGRRETPNSRQISDLRRIAAQINRLGIDAAPDPAVLATLPETEKVVVLGDWVEELAGRDRVDEALTLIEQVAAPRARLDLLERLVYGLPRPKPPVAPQAQSPRSDAAR